MISVCFFNHYPTFKGTFSKDYREKLLSVFHKEQVAFNTGLLSIHFFSDFDLLKLNREILNHDFYTDIITCPIIQTDAFIEADIYISIDRVYDNAKKLGLTFSVELNRVILHGILHLCGYEDKTTASIKIMREKEDYYLEMFHVKHSK